MLKKIAIYAGFLILALLVIALTAILWFERDAEKELDAAKQRLVDMGAPMTIEELLPPPVPEEQNAAPLYLELIAMEEENPAIDQADEDIETLTENHDWNEVYSMSLTDEQFDELERIVNEEELAEYFALLEKITERPYFQPDWDYDLGPHLLIPEVGAQMTASRLLLAKAAVLLHHGDEVGAAEFAEQTLQIAKHVNQSYTLVSILTATAVRNYVFVFLESFDRMSKENAPARLTQLWGSEPLADNWVNALDLERLGMGGTVFPAILDGDKEAKQAIFGEDDMNKIYIAGIRGVRWFFVYDYAHYLNSMADAREFAVLPYYDSIDNERMAMEESVVEASEKYRIISRIILATTSRVRTNIVQSDSQQLLALTGFALSAYHRDHSKYPESLEALVPDYLDEIPVDPLTGSRFIYNREGADYELYGLGPNRVDDGGTTNGDGRADDEEGDLIWKGRGSIFSNETENQ